MDNVSIGEVVFLKGTWTVKEIKDGIATIENRYGDKLYVVERMLKGLKDRFTIE